MTEIIFSRTRYVYDSYVDFWSLVELSGFPIVYVDEMDLYNPEHLYITTPLNGEWRPHLDNHPDKRSQFMLWNLERPGDESVEDFRRSNQELIDRRYLNGVIISDREFAKHTGFHYIPVGSHARLGSPGYNKLYDVIHLMCYALRRSYLFDYLTPRDRYYNMTIAPNGWGHERDIALKSSRYMLNIHQDSHPYIEPLRFALAAAYGLPIISEESSDAFPYVVGRDIFYIPAIEDVHNYIKICNKYYERFRSAGATLRKMMCGEYSFRNCVERYL